MKMKSFALLAAAGGLALSLLSGAPVWADDSMSGSTMQSPTENSNQNQNNMQNSNVGSQNDSNSTNNSNNNANTNSNSQDEGSPDTATGDDDY